MNRFFPYLILLVGVLIAATSSIFARLAQDGGQGAPSLVITSWRLIFATAILTPIAWRTRSHELRSLRRTDMGWGIAAGVLLAAHLATWISSLAYTSVASSVALVATNPLWVALVVRFIFGEKLSRDTILGLIAGFSGSTLIAFSDGGILSFAGGSIHFTPENLIAPTGKADTALFGDFLALIGAVTIAGYLLVGRNLRSRLSNTAYVWVVYTAAMVAIVSATLFSGYSLFGYNWEIYLWMFLMALGPQLLGHTSFNWALAHLSATLVALVALGEPIGSAILAFFIFGETFEPVQLAGFALLIFGIALGILGENNTGKR